MNFIRSAISGFTPESFTSTERYLMGIKDKSKHKADVALCIVNSSKRSKTSDIFWAQLKGKYIFQWSPGKLEQTATTLLRADRCLFVAGLVCVGVSPCFVDVGWAFAFGVSLAAGYTCFESWRTSYNESFEQQIALREIREAIFPKKITTTYQKVQSYN